MERLNLVGFIANGGSVYFYNGDMLKLKEDLERVKPTIFASVPRLFNRIHDGIKDKIGAAEGIAKSIATSGIETKLKNLQNDQEYTHFIYDNLVFNKTKQAFGGRVRLMVTGSAPINGDTLNFLKICTSCPIVEGYG